MCSDTCIRTYEKLEECTVKMSPALAKMCKPYSGCPRGHIGAKGASGSEPIPPDKEILLDWLLEWGRYTLKGQEDDFVCIPQCVYEDIIRKVEQLKE